MHNVNHIHLDEKEMEIALAISCLWSGKDLKDPHNDHPFHKGLIDEEKLTIMEKQDISSKDEDEHTKAEPNPDTYKPLVPYP